MFDGTGTPRKPQERAAARQMRTRGMPIKRIAARLGVAPSSVLYWTRDITLTPEQRLRNARGPSGPQNPEVVRRRVEAVKERARERRREAQLEGRMRARRGDGLHQAGCMLYWAEGAKGRNSVVFANSDRAMVVFFCRFLRQCFDVTSQQMTIRLNVYTSNGLTLREIEDHWLWALELPRSALRKHSLNHRPTSSSGGRRHKLPYGVCTLRATRSTAIVQHIYGAIQEYGGFEEPRWLDGPPRGSAAL